MNGVLRNAPPGCRQPQLTAADLWQQQRCLHPQHAPGSARRPETGPAEAGESLVQVPASEGLSLKPRFSSLYDQQYLLLTVNSI